MSESIIDNKHLTRSSRILVHKFKKYLLPSTLTAIAVSLNEFVDSLIVARLLGSHFMSVVNIGMPVMFLANAIFVLFGVGGASLYANYIGERKKEEAGSVCALSVLMALGLGLAILLFGIIFLNPLCGVLCGDNPQLLDEVKRYIPALLAVAPMITFTLSLSLFFPAAGMPALTTAINITANVVNLIMDYVYIGILGMGVSGAAWATFSGYTVGIFLVIFMFMIKKVKLQFSTPRLKYLKDIATRGMSNAVGQLGFAIKFTFCNNIAIALGGAGAMAVFSVCIQTISIVSIFLQGIADATAPILATLHGQRDVQGKRFLLKTSVRYIFIISSVLVVGFWVFPEFMLGLYNITDPDVVTMGITAIRIFSLMFLFRGIYILFMIVSSITGSRIYAVLISLFDGVIGTVIFGTILTLAFGLNGLWITFPITSAALLFAVTINNINKIKKSNGELMGFFLQESHPFTGPVYDITIDNTNEDISRLSCELSDFCRDNNVSKSTSIRVGLLAEEMAVYTKNHNAGKKYNVDVLAHIENNSLILDFRSEGAPFNPLNESAGDESENILILRGLSNSIQYDYILGMNSTRIEIAV